VRADKEREARAGHDGTWVAHPALIPSRRACSTCHAAAEPVFVRREDVAARGEADLRDTLLAPSPGSITRAGFSTTSMSACATSRPGSMASAACRSIT
jgi:malate synthase